LHLKSKPLSEAWLHLCFPALILELKIHGLDKSYFRGGVLERQLGDISFLGLGEMEGKNIAAKSQRGLN